jgi:glycosyltransferase involved in cell wall biosynthesis
MKILFLSRWLPYPVNNGSKLRIFNLLKGLAHNHSVTLLSFVEPSAAPPDPSVMQELCTEYYTVPWREFDPKSRKARLGFLSSKPRFIADTYSIHMETEICRLVSKNKFDLVIASQLTMASYSAAYGGVKAVFEEIELGGFYEKAHITGEWPKRIRHWLTWLKLKSYMSQVLKNFAVCSVVSEKERKIFIDAFPHHQNKAVVIPNCIDLTEYRISDIARKRNHIVFSGSFRYQANYDAVLWFLREVYPLILKHVSDIQLLITGDHADLPLPMTQNVRRVGHVEDIKTLIASCDASIVPIWSGGGTRLKILEAMAVGTPVISTSKGAEGLLAIPGEHILIADEPERFAALLRQLLLDKEFSNQLSSNAYRLVEEQYDWTKVMPRFLRMVEEAVAGFS